MLLLNPPPPPPSFTQIAPHRFDTGEVLAFSPRVPITCHMNSHELTGELARLGGDLLVSTLSELPARLCDATAQDLSSGEPAPKIELSDSFVDFARFVVRLPDSSVEHTIL